MLGIAYTSHVGVRSMQSKRQTKFDIKIATGNVRFCVKNGLLRTTFCDTIKFLVHDKHAIISSLKECISPVIGCRTCHNELHCIC